MLKLAKTHQKKPLANAYTLNYSVGMKKHPTNIHFDLDLWEWLKQESHRRRASISQIVRELVAREMDSQRVKR